MYRERKEQPQATRLRALSIRVPEGFLTSQTSFGMTTPFISSARYGVQAGAGAEDGVDVMGISFSDASNLLRAGSVSLTSLLLAATFLP